MTDSYKPVMPKLVSVVKYIVAVATLCTSSDEKKAIIRAIEDETKLIVDEASLPDEIVFERKQSFKDGDLKGNFLTLLTQPLVREKAKRKFRSPEGDERAAIRNVVYGYTPDISYFPTFVFDFPKTIFLTDRGDELDQFYRRVFQDILDYDGKGHTIEKDIVRRVRGERKRVPWPSFFELWIKDDDRDKIKHVMDRASAAVTELVFGRWNRIFGEDVKGKEIEISYEVVEGEKKDERGVATKTNEHDIYIKFQIRDGTRRFVVNDRSLGFRWFFAFMLFTQFRVARKRTRPLLSCLTSQLLIYTPLHSRS